MAGTIRGSIEHLISATGQNFNVDHFIAAVKFLESHPSWTSIASWGRGATGAPSTWDYSGGANVPGSNAWVVFQNTGGAYSWFVMLQFSWSDIFGNPGTGGEPGDVQSDYYNGVQMAFDTSGGTNIWNGTTNNDGTDTKGAVVWVPDGGTVVVHPRSNGSGGTFVTPKEAHAQMVAAAGAPGRFQLLADDDYLWWGSDLSNNGSYDSAGYMGPFTPDDGVTMPGPPLLMYQQGGDLSDYGAVGTLDNSSPTDEGGVIAAVGQDQSRIFKCPMHGGWFSTTQQPNAQRSPASHDEIAIPLCVDDADGSGTFGYLGKIELVKMAFNVPTHDTNGAMTKAFFGSASTATRHWIVDWDGSTVPGTGGTREGIQFP
jgi:hypothetical protein